MLGLAPISSLFSRRRKSEHTVTVSSDRRFVLPKLSDKDKAIQTARQVIQYEQAGITISPSETLNLSREYLRELGLIKRQPDNPPFRRIPW